MIAWAERFAGFTDGRAGLPICAGAKEDFGWDKELPMALTSAFGAAVCWFPFAGVVQASLGMRWTSDPLDRLTVGQAAANRNAALITRDRLLQRNSSGSVWQGMEFGFASQLIALTFSTRHWL